MKAFEFGIEYRKDLRVLILVRRWSKETIHEDCLRELKLISRAQMEKSALNKRSIFSFHCIRKGKRK